MEFDLLLFNGSFITVNDDHPKAKWVAIQEGMIAAIGDNQPPVEQSKKTIDLKGSTVLPGLMDCHVHGTLTGLALDSADLSEARSKKEIMETINHHINCLDTQGMITAVNLSLSTLASREIPKAWDLDELSRDQIIILFDKSLHGMVLNTVGLDAAGMKVGMVGVETIGGQPSGVISDDTSYYHGIQTIMKDTGEDLIPNYMRAVEGAALSRGITCIHSLNGGDFLVDMPGWILYEDQLKLRVVNYWETMNLDCAREYGLPRIGGCICLDGSRMLHTMALMDPYNDRQSTRGFLYYSDDAIYQFVKGAHLMGIQCAMHATGDRAIDQYINILRQVILEEGEKDLRHRIEHFSLPTEKHIELAIELDLALSMQPSFSLEWDKGEESLYRKRFGLQRSNRMEPLATILEKGGKICGGSDSPVTPMDPFYGMEACINNPNPIRRISFSEALKIYSINNAWAAHEEDQRGSIEVGKVADLAVIDKEIDKMGASIDTVKVIATFVRGELVFKNKDQNILGETR